MKNWAGFGGDRGRQGSSTEWLSQHHYEPEHRASLTRRSGSMWKAQGSVSSCFSRTEIQAAHGLTLAASQAMHSAY